MLTCSCAYMGAVLLSWWAAVQCNGGQFCNGSEFADLLLLALHRPIRYEAQKRRPP